MHIAVGIPNTGTIKTNTMWSVVDLIYAGARAKLHLHLIGREGCYVQVNRYEIVQQALAERCDKILFVDADMQFSGDVLPRLLAHQKPIIGVNYYTRRFPLVSTVKLPGVSGPTGETSSAKTIPTELFECFAVGTGLMLIDLHVFRKLPQPWFQVTHKPDGAIEYGEDVWFCRHARKHGFRVWCDPTIDVSHIGDFRYKDYERFPEAKGGVDDDADALPAPALGEPALAPALVGAE